MFSSRSSTEARHLHGSARAWRAITWRVCKEQQKGKNAHSHKHVRTTEASSHWISDAQHPSLNSDLASHLHQAFAVGKMAYLTKSAQTKVNPDRSGGG